MVEATSEYESVEVSGIERQSGSTFSTNKKTVYFNVRGVAENGNKGSWTQVSADVTESYNTGAGSVTIPQTNMIQYQSAAYDSTSGNYSVYIRAEASNGSAQTRTFTVSGSAAYNAGVDSVYVSGAERQSGNTFSDNKKTVYFNIRGIASNGDTGDWTQVSADVSTSYNAGYDAGESDGYDEGYDDGYSVGYNSGYSVGYDVGFADGEKQFAVLNPNFSGGLYDSNGKFIGAGNWYLSYGAAVYGKT